MAPGRSQRPDRRHVGGLACRRARLHHLRGSSSATYEADPAIMLKPKTSPISEVAPRLRRRPGRVSFRKMVVLSNEKNRNGPAGIHLEFTGEVDRFPTPTTPPRPGLTHSRPEDYSFPLMGQSSIALSGVRPLHSVQAETQPG